MKILKESYLTNTTYLYVTGGPSCGREIIAIVAVDAVDVGLNSGFKQFVIDVASYAATNP